MTKRAKVIACLLLAIVLALFSMVGVGVFMVTSTYRQNEMLERSREEDKEAKMQRKLIIEGNRRVQAVTDCIIIGPPPPFRECVTEKLSTTTTTAVRASD